MGRASTRKALNRIIACESCDPCAALPFRSVLDAVLGRWPETTDYLITEPLRCPCCSEQIFGKTLVTEPTEAGNAAVTFSEADVLPRQTIVIDEAKLREAQAFLVACECCDSNAGITFDYLLDALTERGSPAVEYVLSCPVRCPQCCGEVTGKTFVIPG